MPIALAPSENAAGDPFYDLAPPPDRPELVGGDGAAPAYQTVEGKTSEVPKAIAATFEPKDLGPFSDLVAVTNPPPVADTTEDPFEDLVRDSSPTPETDLVVADLQGRVDAIANDVKGKRDLRESQQADMQRGTFDAFQKLFNDVKDVPAIPLASNETIAKITSGARTLFPWMRLLPEAETRGAIAGVNDLVSGLTTPTNVALLASVGATPKLIQVAIGLGFSAQASQDIYHRVKQLPEITDPAERTRQYTNILGDAAVATAGAVGAVFAGKGVSDAAKIESASPETGGEIRPPVDEGTSLRQSEGGVTGETDPFADLTPEGERASPETSGVQPASETIDLGVQSAPTEQPISQPAETGGESAKAAGSIEPAATSPAVELPSAEPAPTVVRVMDKEFHGESPLAAHEAARQELFPDMTMEQFVEGAKQEPDYTVMSAAQAKAKATRAATRAKLEEDARIASEQELTDAAKESQARGGNELFVAIERAGGMPAKTSPHRATMKGELDALEEEFSRQAGDKARKGVRPRKLFRPESGSMDALAETLREQGFGFEDGNDVIAAVQNRMRSGKEHYPEKDTSADVFGFGPGPAASGEFLARGRQSAIAIKNADIDARRAKRGDPPLIKPLRQSNPESWDRAMDRIEADPTLPGRLADQINAGEKEGTSTIEQLMLLHEEIRLDNERQMAAERSQDRDTYGERERAQFREETKSIEDRLRQVEAAGKLAGTEAGRALQVRQARVFDDYTMAAALTRAENAKGEPLSKEERTQVEDNVAKVDEAKKEFQKAQDDASRQQALDVLSRVISDVMRETVEQAKAGRGLRDILHDRRDAAYARIKARRGKLQVTVDPLNLAGLVDEAIIGASHIADGLVDRVEWAKKMVSDFGEKIKPYLESLFDRSKELHDSTAELIKGVKPEKKKRGKTEPKVSPIEAAHEVAEEGGELTKKMIFDLARQHVQNGMRDLNEVMEAVRLDLEEDFPDTTVREIRDLFSDYGKRRYPSQEEDLVTLRELHRLGQLESALEDVAKGENPQKSGGVRDKPSQLIREKTRQLKDAMREAGIETRSPEEQLASVNQQRETALRNQIEDLEKEIRTGERRNAAAAGKVVPDTPLVAELKRRRDALSKQAEKLRQSDPEFQRAQETARIERRSESLGKEIQKLRKQAAGQAPEKLGQRVNRPEVPDIEKLLQERDEIRAEIAAKTAAKGRQEALRARLQTVEDRIDETLAKLSQGDIEAAKGKAKAKPETTPELDRATAELKTLLKQMADLRRERGSSNLERLKRMNKALDRKMAEVKARLKAKNYQPLPKRAKTELDNETLRKKADLVLAQRELNAHINNLRLENQGPGAKTARFVGEVANAVRSLKTAIDLSAVLRQGGFLALSHPIASAKIIPDMLRALRSEHARTVIEEQIKARDNYPRYLRAKLYLSDNTNLADMEEVYMSRWARKIPLVAASERAYVTYLNRIRADAFDILADSFRAGTPEEDVAIARYINIVTGRGDLGHGKVAEAARALNTLFFAPRFVISRFETIAGVPFYKGTLRTRGIVATEYARMLLGASVVYGLGSLAGAQVETDPRSSDFWKLRFGNARLDPFFGLIQATVYLARLSGKEKIIDGGLRPIGFISLTANFLRDKLAPVPGAMVDARDILVGQKPPKSHAQHILPQSLSLSDLQNSILVGLFVSINAGDIVKVMQDQGIERGTALSIVSTFGMGVQVYQAEQLSTPAAKPAPVFPHGRGSRRKRAKNLGL